ncbi:SDR family oxidoreductase [Buttiauxella sp. B2]|uniref:SDR family oxidoreductase n=1 Tax=Buttiauxella sp. B2 TaxID=2587812 RepID=UPI00111FFFA2|nr:SDR family oxidoreductase [Buttiauxella sp. B2]TNV09823.1 SDR family oxidoreductase [Buttiauxella sp. B2]
MSNACTKTILITAAAQGIGLATALLLAQKGFQVIATDIDRAKLAELSSQPGIRTEFLDVLDTDSISTLVQRLPHIDVLFNCAGIVQNGDALGTENVQLELAWHLNVMSQFNLIKAVLPGMLAQKDGCIINMSSIASSIKGVPNRCAYSVTKAAVIGLTKSVAADYIAHGIRCNAICPGTVETPSLQQRLEDTGDYNAAREAFIARQPMGRIGQPQEIAELVLYLTGATFTTGQAHHIDGGWSA